MTTITRLTISSLTLRGAPFSERVRAAVLAGFAGIGLSVDDYLAARRDGLDDDAMRAMLDAAGIAVTEVEFLSDWVPGKGAIQPSSREVAAFHIARVFGADHVNVGRFDKSPMDLMADGFAALCERAGGVKVALEYMPFGAIPDLDAAWELVRRSGQPNAGLVIDVWHWVRGSTTPGDLAQVPPDRIFAVQLCDVGPDPLADMRQESLHHRLVPGSRTRHAEDVLAILTRHGVDVDLSVEVMSDALLAEGFQTTAAKAFAGARKIITERG